MRKYSADKPTQVHGRRVRRKIPTGNDENTSRPSDNDIFNKDEGLGGNGESAMQMAERMQREREKE